MSYLHSYQPIEQARLERQASLLEPLLYQGWECLGNPQSLLEVGCGTGAQLRRLGKLYPQARRVGLDRSAEQLASAQLQDPGGQIQWVQGCAEDLPFSENSFDLVCLFWVLEHVARPEAVFRSIDRVLKSGGRVAISEVQNSSLSFYPHCPQAMAYWAAYNQCQRELGGHPEIGLQLPALARQQGWHILRVRRFAPRLHDGVDQPVRRQQVVDFWLDLLASALPSLRQQQKEPGDFQAVRQELQALVHHPRAVIDYSAHQLLACKPQKGRSPGVQMEF